MSPKAGMDGDAEQGGAEAAGGGAPSLGSELLIFRAGAEYFALPLAGVEAVIELPTVQPLPGMPDGMLGVSELRGSLVPVYSPARVLRVGLDPGAVILVRLDRTGLGGAGRHIAIAVSAAEGVLPYDPATWSGVGGPAPRTGLVRGVASVDGRLMTLVDAAAFLDACIESAPAGAS